MSSNDYDNNNRCPKCNSQNTFANEQYEGNILSEVETFCTNKNCLYEGYWSYGYYSFGREVLEEYDKKIREQKELNPKYAQLVEDNFWDLI